MAGASGGESVCQPAWDPASGRLHFVSDRGGWYNLYVVEEDGGVRCAPRDCRWLVASERRGCLEEALSCCSNALD